MPDTTPPTHEGGPYTVSSGTGGVGGTASGSSGSGGGGAGGGAAAVVYGTQDDVIKLNLNDPFDLALKLIHETGARKKNDYASREDRFSNFALTSAYFGIDDFQSADFNELQKLARLKQLNRNGFAPEYEPVYDTYLDKAVYAVLALAMYMRANNRS